MDRTVPRTVETDTVTFLVPPARSLGARGVGHLRHGGHRGEPVVVYRPLEGSQLTVRHSLGTATLFHPVAGGRRALGRSRVGDGASGTPQSRTDDQNRLSLLEEGSDGGALAVGKRAMC